MSGDDGESSNDVKAMLGFDPALPENRSRLERLLNAENKVIFERTWRNEEESRRLVRELENHDTSIEMMSKHLKGVYEELTITMKLKAAHQTEIARQQHMRKLAAREAERLTKCSLAYDKEMAQLNERRARDEKTIFMQKRQLDELKSQMNWDQKALDAWLKESARKDDDAMVLAKYTRMDEDKIKSLTREIEKLQLKKEQKRRQMDDQKTEALTVQIKLDTAAADFRKEYMERLELIQRWERQLDQMKARDTENNLLAVQIANVKNDLAAQEEKLREKQEFLGHVEADNAALEKRITHSEKELMTVRTELKDAEKQEDEFHSNLDTLTRDVSETALRLEGSRFEVKQYQAQLKQMKAKLQHITQLNADAEAQLASQVDKTLSTKERLTRYQEALAREETLQRDAEKELARLISEKSRKSKLMEDARKEERVMEAAIETGRAAVRGGNRTIKDLDTKLLKQKTTEYHQELTLHKLNSRISRMEGEQANDDKLQLEQRIAKLEKDLDAKKQVKETLNASKKSNGEVLNRTRRHLQKLIASKDDITVQMEEVELHNVNATRELETKTKTKQNLMVEENLLKLDLKKLRGALNTKKDAVFSLEKRRLQLDTAMKERRHEINLHREMLIAQLKQAELERQEITSELQKRLHKIEVLQKRYETMTMACPADVEKEKEELWRKGDDLHNNIKEKERENRAFKIMKQDLNLSNSALKKSFRKVREGSEEMATKQQLEEQYRAVMDKYKYKRRQIRELQEDLQTMSRTLEQLSGEEAALLAYVGERESLVRTLMKEISEQEAKLQRAATSNARLQREVRTAAKAKGELPEERDFTVRELRDMNKNAMKTMGEVIQQFPETTQSIHLYFTQANLPPPPTPGPGSRGTMSCSSARSSASSSSSQRSGKSPSTSPGSSAPGTPVSSSRSSKKSPGTRPGISSPGTLALGIPASSSRGFKKSPGTSPPGSSAPSTPASSSRSSKQTPGTRAGTSSSGTVALGTPASSSRGSKKSPGTSPGSSAPGTQVSSSRGSKKSPGTLPGTSKKQPISMGAANFGISGIALGGRPSSSSSNRSSNKDGNRSNRK